MKPVELAVLCGPTAGWHVQDLRRAATRLGLHLAVADFRRLSALVAPRNNEEQEESRTRRRGGHGAERSRNVDGTATAYSDVHLAELDGLIVRTMPAGSLEEIIFRMDVLHRVETTTRVFNRPRALETAIDKYLCTVRLQAAGLSVPKTHVSQCADSALSGFDELGGDVVIKPLFGSEGRGLLRVQSLRNATEEFRRLEAEGRVIYQQRFVPNPGCDIRLFVCGDEVIASMRRFAAAGDWRTNVAQGGRAAVFTAPPELTDIAMQAARAVGADIAGVDILPDHDGRWWLLEVNGVPGWRSIAAVSGIDIAAELLAWIRGEIVGLPKPSSDQRPARREPASKT